MKELCDLYRSDGIAGGYFDGPRAWRMIEDRLFGGQRSEVGQRTFTGLEERLQRSSKLPDGCSAEEYARKALAFLIHIRPYLAQTYDDDDTSQYLIDLMPKALREGGRRITTELKTARRYHDHMHVLQKCRQLVHEEQRAPAPTPAFVVVDAAMLSVHQIDDMRRRTGTAPARRRRSRAPTECRRGPGAALQLPARTFSCLQVAAACA